jgi:hypothetical protein
MQYLRENVLRNGEIGIDLFILLLFTLSRVHGQKLAVVPPPDCLWGVPRAEIQAETRKFKYFWELAKSQEILMF